MGFSGLMPNLVKVSETLSSGRSLFLSLKGSIDGALTKTLGIFRLGITYFSDVKIAASYWLRKGSENSRLQDWVWISQCDISKSIYRFLQEDTES